MIRASVIRTNNKTAASTIWGGIKTAVTTPINAVKSFISNAFTSIKNTATRIWNGIKEAITKPITSARDTIKGIIDKIKGFFPLSIGNLFSGIKLPHFEWHWKEIVGKLKIPIFDRISWYAKGGIVDGASIIGAGEKGPEGIIPLSGAAMRPFAKAIAGEMKDRDSKTTNVFNLNYDASDDARDMLRDIMRGVNRYRRAGAF